MPNTYCLKDFEEWLEEQRNTAAHKIFHFKEDTKLEMYYWGRESALHEVLAELAKLKKEE